MAKTELGFRAPCAKLLAPVEFTYSSDEDASALGEAVGYTDSIIPTLLKPFCHSFFKQTRSCVTQRVPLYLPCLQRATATRRKCGR